jgi:hypothetical protein
MGIAGTAPLLSETPCASVCETSVPTTTERPPDLCEAFVCRLGIVRTAPLFRQPLYETLCETLSPNLWDRANDLDCDQYRSQDQSNDQSSNGAHCDHENSTLKSSVPGVKPYDLMPPAVHMVSKS